MNENPDIEETKLEEDITITIGKGLMMVAGSDKEITDPEMGWLENEWLSSHEDKENKFDILLRFNYREEEFISFFQSLAERIESENLKRVFIYQSIKMSSADEIYSDEEKESVAQVAEIFNIENDVLSAIESLVEMESAVNITKTAILNTDS